MENYRNALDAAMQELKEVEESLARYTRRKAQLQQIVFGLRTLMGENVEEQSLTETIRLVLQAAEEFLSAQEVVERIELVSDSVNPVSVATILNRLAKNKEALTGKTKDGRVGYKWNQYKGMVTQVPAIRGKAK